MNFNGYIYLNLRNPLVCWETYRGILISADKTEDIENKHPSLWLASKIRHEKNVALANELLIEHIRVNYFPTKISRLRGLYVFRDLDSAQYALDWGGHFVFDNLVEVEILTDNDLTRLDANWITFAELDRDGYITENYIDSIKKYWEGIQFNNDPCWEYIVNGRATIFGTRVRQQAYNIIKEEMPETLGLLELSRIAALLGSDLGHCIPWIQRTEEDTYHLRHVINFKDATDASFLDKLSRFNSPKNTTDLNSSLQYFTVPDLRRFDCIFKTSSTKMYNYSNMRIHISR